MVSGELLSLTALLVFSQVRDIAVDPADQIIGFDFQFPDEGLIAISQGLGTKPWCTGNHYTLADIAVGCALGYLDFRMPELNCREGYPNLDKHFQKLSLRQSFIDTVPAD